MVLAIGSSAGGSTAGRVATTATGQAPIFRVLTFARTAEFVIARGGLRILPDHTIHDDLPIDILVIPGGVTGAVERDDTIIKWIDRRHRAALLTLGICTGAFLLAEAGVLDGRPATTHWEDQDELQRRWPTVDVRRDPRWIDDCDVVTSAGISAGIDASLHVVRRLLGAKLATRTARQMEYDWRDQP